MPIYAYRCQSCGHAKDVLQKVSDPLLTVCPACGAETFRKQLTAAGFQLKGSGWYVTDFKGGGAAPPATVAPKDGSGEKEGSDAKGAKAADAPAASPAAATTDVAAAPSPAPAPAAPGSTPSTT
jgi:putative FmdB family regulatory protein